MSDFERAMRRAVDGTAADTVRPPFERIVRAHRRRRATRLAAAGVAVAAVLGGAAVALPDRDRDRTGVTASPSPSPSPSLRPFRELRRDVAGRAAVRQCLKDAGAPVPMPGGQDVPTELWILDGTWKSYERDGADPELPHIMDRCLVQSGYEPHAVAYDAPIRADARVDRDCKDDSRTGVVGRGTVQGTEWEVRAYQAEGRICTRASWGGKEQFRWVERLDQSAYGQYHREPFVTGGLDMLVWGFTQPDAVRVELFSNGRPTPSDTVRLPGIDRPLYAFSMRIDPRGEREQRFAEYDAAGNRLPNPRWYPEDRTVSPSPS